MRFLLRCFAYLIALIFGSISGVVASVVEVAIHAAITGGEPHISMWVIGFVTGCILLPLDGWLNGRFNGEAAQ